MPVRINRQHDDLRKTRRIHSPVSGPTRSEQRIRSNPFDACTVQMFSIKPVGRTGVNGKPACAKVFTEISGEPTWHTELIARSEREASKWVAHFRDKNSTMRFSNPADHPLVHEFDAQLCKLVKEYAGDGEFLAVHHPAEPDAHDDAPDSTALALIAAACSGIGEILFLRPRNGARSTHCNGRRRESPADLRQAFCLPWLRLYSSWTRRKPERTA